MNGSHGVGDSMLSNNGQEFSSVDRDNDAFPFGRPMRLIFQLLVYACCGVVCVCLRPPEVQLAKTNTWASVASLGTQLATKKACRLKGIQLTEVKAWPHGLTSDSKVGQSGSVAGVGHSRLFLHFL